MESIVSQGIQVLIPPDAGKRKGTRPGWDGGPYAFMRRVLETTLGNALYRKRQVTVEPVFAHTKFNRRIDRFQRRGRFACRSELACSPLGRCSLGCEVRALSSSSRGSGRRIATGVCYGADV
jgi:hypothetical protein